MWLVEVPLQLESSPTINIANDSCVVQRTLTMRSIMALGKSAGSSSFRMSMGRQLPYVIGLARLHAHGWDPLVPTATGVYEGPRQFYLVRGMSRITLLAELGGRAGSWRRAVIGLNLRLNPIQKKCGQARVLVVQQG
jgi:hypothetical protein